MRHLRPLWAVRRIGELARVATIADTPSRGPDLSVISSMATREPIAALAEAFGQASAWRVRAVAAGGVDVARRVRDGEHFDLVVLAAGAIESLIADGLLKAGSRVDFVRSAMGVAVRAGSPKPDLSSETAWIESLRHAQSIGYSTGPSGDHLIRLLDRYGLTDSVSPKLRRSPAGVPVASMIARGEVEFGVQQISELVNVPNVELAGALPPGSELITMFSAAASVSVVNEAALAEWLSLMNSPDSDAVKRRFGLEPAIR